MMENDGARILEGLNEEQLKAVKCVDGPVLIVAGAGSGKTRVLTSRVAHMLSLGVDPSGVLALTFTKKAAGEMKQRIAMAVGEYKARRVVMGTFHSVFVRFLREYASLIGYPENFTIYDQPDSTSAVKACLKELGLDDKVYKPRNVQSRISMAKNSLITVDAYRANRDLIQGDIRAQRPRFVDVYELYCRRNRTSGVMDFDDILLNMNYLLRDHKDALEAISSRFSHILVDEYQDTNTAQYLIIKKLASRTRNICVVGDDSQSIYAFRGAKIENILNFKRDFPECRTFRLERNYRSTGNIVEAANSLISHNKGRIPKECYADGEPGERLHIIKAYNEQEEALLTVGEILGRMRREGAAYSDFAILYRKNSQSRAFEEQLRRRNIPYMIYSGNSFFERAEVKDLMAYFKLALNPNDDESLKRVVNKPARAIGDTTVSALNECARAEGLSLFKAISSENLLSYGVRPAAVDKLKGFARMIDSFAVAARTSDAYELARRIAEESGLLMLYRSDTSIEGQARAANVEELLNSVSSYVEEQMEEVGDNVDEKPVFTLADYVEDVSLLSAVDVDEDEASDRVALMTVHSSKGLEFPYVFVAGMEENIFPLAGMNGVVDDVEEERRLCYVALTRAKRFATFSYAESRMDNGKRESNSPSRFLLEIEAKYFDNPVADTRVPLPSFARPSFRRPGNDFRRPSQPSQPMPSQVSRPNFVKPPVVDPDFIPAPAESFRVGDRIEHNRFGAGLIKNISGTAPELKAVIVFDNYGEKIILLKFAKMRMLK